MKQDQAHGDAYNAVRMIYDASPGRSWRRLNGALHGVLDAAITARLSFLPDDFRAIYQDMNGGYWMGNSEGSACGERYYRVMVEIGHTPACVAFEKYAGRPAALWSEDVKTPVRLHIGSEFTWMQKKLTVTNMLQDRLVACSYKGSQYGDSRRAIGIGAFERLNDCNYRQVEEIVPYPDGAATIRFGPPIPDPYARKVDRIFKITFEDLYDVRAKHDKARRIALSEITSAGSLEGLESISTGIAQQPAGTYRHFDTEDIRKAIAEREKALGLDRERLRRSAAYAKAEADALERWVKGENARGYFQTVRLRVRDGKVETSTGQYASVESVRRALPVVLRRRNSFGPVRNLRVDSFNVVEQTTVGVKVGCTLVPWPEVERLEALIA